MMWLVTGFEGGGQEGGLPTGLGSPKPGIYASSRPQSPTPLFNRQQLL